MSNVALTDMPAGAPVPILGVVSVVAGGRAASEVAEELLAQLADEPRVVQCDLTGTTLTDVRAGEDFAPVGSYLRHWPGTVVMMHVPDPDVRAALSAADLAEHVLVHGTWDAAELRAHRLLPAVQRRSLTLPHERARRARHESSWPEPCRTGGCTR